jgi:hypothetical protein
MCDLKSKSVCSAALRNQYIAFVPKNATSGHFNLDLNVPFIVAKVVAVNNDVAHSKTYHKQLRWSLQLEDCYSELTTRNKKVALRVYPSMIPQQVRDLQKKEERQLTTAEAERVLNDWKASVRAARPKLKSDPVPDKWAKSSSYYFAETSPMRPVCALRVISVSSCRYVNHRQLKELLPELVGTTSHSYLERILGGERPVALPSNSSGDQDEGDSDETTGEFSDEEEPFIMYDPDAESESESGKGGLVGTQPYEAQDDFNASASASSSSSSSSSASAYPPQRQQHEAASDECNPLHTEDGGFEQEKLKQGTFAEPEEELHLFKGGGIGAEERLEGGVFFDVGAEEDANASGSEEEEEE